MFEVLVFVYEHYWRGDACPELESLGRKLSAQGFDADEIQDALVWLDGLHFAAQNVSSLESTLHASITPSEESMRVYSVAEQQHLGAESLGFIAFLASSGVLPAPLRETVIDRAMAAPGAPVSLDLLKIIVMMVYWSFGTEPDALILDELCESVEGRVAH